ncbi:MAG: molybdopterin cofactor-binding domain-containing protein [Pseudomonadota bacterium]
MKEVRIKINGVWRQFLVEPDRALIDTLRQDLALTGVKQSCDRLGQCGACTVIVDGKAARSCLLKAGDLEGAEVITIEGLGTPDNPHLIQEAFVLAGAVQCGFCTPGMIMAAKALLDADPDPDDEAIKSALKRNLCRCTGYKKIIEAVRLAGRFLRGEVSPEQMRPDPAAGMIGVSHIRPTAFARACGTAQFTADIAMQGALELAAVRSPHAHALIKSIDTSAAEALPGVVGVLTARDILGSNRLKYLVDDQPLLCEGEVHVLGDAVAAVVARGKAEALAGAAAVRVEYEPLPAVATAQEALAEGAPQAHTDRPNLCFSHPQIKGDAEAALEQCAATVEAEFSTQLIHQAPLEPEAALAWMEGQGEEAKLVVKGRGINIHHHLMVLQGALGWENMRYEEAFSGGQFGIKLDITAEGLAAAAALKFRAPVRYVCSLRESMWITTKRHPFQMRVKLGADAQGRLLAYLIDFVLENGAYTSWGIAILLRALQMLSGAYHIPHVKALGRLVYTNDAWGGAARGAGPPQINFALESALDMLARKLDMDPLEIRRVNALQPGQSTSTGQVVDEWAYGGCLEALAPLYDEARSWAAAGAPEGFKRGVGLAGASFGIGKAGPGDKSYVAVELMPDGGLTVYGSVADPGEGNDAMLTQIAAHLTGLPPEKIYLVTRDTDRTPDASSASGSRVTYMSGGAMAEAIAKLQAALAEAGASDYAGLVAAGKPTKYLGSKVQSTTALDPQTGQGAPYDSRVHGVQMAQVEVEVASGQVRVAKITAVVDPGRVLNPTIVEGQLEGGLDMGVGMALREHYVHGQSRDWLSFKFPTIKMSFPSRIVLVETPRAKGTLGAVGVGEFVLMPTAAAVMNAIDDASGARVRHLPATPEKVRQALELARTGG